MHHVHCVAIPFVYCCIIIFFFPFYFDWNSLHRQIFYENEFWIDYTAAVWANYWKIQLSEKLFIFILLFIDGKLFICIRFLSQFQHRGSRIFEEMSLIVSPMEKSEQKKWNYFKAALNFKVDFWKEANVEPLENRMLHTTHITQSQSSVHSKLTANKHIVESVIFAIRIESYPIVCTRKSNSCQVQLFKPKQPNDNQLNVT